MVKMYNMQLFGGLTISVSLKIAAKTVFHFCSLVKPGIEDVLVSACHQWSGRGITTNKDKI